MQASDIMSTPVIAIGPQASLTQAIDLLLEHRISGMPVVEAGRVVGLLGDGDLVHRRELGTEHDPQSWWRRFLLNDSQAADYVRTHGHRVCDVMNPCEVTIQPRTPVAQIARLFEDRRIRRLPVLRDETLVGLVTRADLVRMLAARAHREDHDDRESASGNDASIRERLIRELSTQSWWSAGASDVTVENGVVRYAGMVRGPSEQMAARVAAENVPGVRGVDDRRVTYDPWQAML